MDNNVDNLNSAATRTTDNLATTSTTGTPSTTTAVETPQALTAQNKQQPQQQPITTNSFWKNSNRIVPGRPSPKRVNATIGLGGDLGVSGGVGGIGMMATFRDYQNSVSDAWDTGDDEFCIISNAAATQQQHHHQHRGSDEVASLHKTGNYMEIVINCPLLRKYLFVLICCGDPFFDYTQTREFPGKSHKLWLKML